jgi:dienelactone hydrolase
MSRRRQAFLILALPLTLAAAIVAADYVRGAALVVQAANIEGWPHTVASWLSGAYRLDDRQIPTRHGSIRGRVYRPDGTARRRLLLVPGVHASGIDEPRLMDFAGHLAARGILVVTAEPPDLRRYEITPRSTDVIEDAALWLTNDATLSPDGHASLAGISFAGGLAVVAAGRPALRDRVSFVLSLGGHGDLPRTLRYLCTGVQPDGTRRPPHDYGVVIILFGVADRLVPPDELPALRGAILTFLEASHLDMVDKPRAAETFARARAMEETLPEPSKTLMHYVNTRDVAHLGPLLLPHLAELAGDPALSPERSAPPRAATYLLHGADDNVIPAMESQLLAARLSGSAEVHLLVTPLITHAEVGRPSQVGEVWKLIRFWTLLLDEG